MPVTKSSKRALRVAHRRAKENVRTRSAYKRALKAARNATETGTEKAGALLNKLQSSLDIAAKNNTIHRNKAARLKSRLAKKLGANAKAAAKAVKTTGKKVAAATKTTAKKATKKSSKK